MAEIRGELVGKCPVAVIDIEQIGFFKIIGHIDIRPAIKINIGNNSTQTKSVVPDTGLPAYISKFSVPVLIQTKAYILSCRIIDQYDLVIYHFGIYHHVIVE